MLIEASVAHGPLDRPLRRVSVVARPWMAVAALLLLCAAKGAWMTAGVQAPPDPDTVRDLGFIQGFLDGNWFGDPATAGAWRWYPPLLHGLAALLLKALGLPLLPTWLRAGAWLNLLSPLMFYLMNRRLIGAWPGAAATMVFVLFSGLVTPGDATAGYTPWTLTPALAWPLFFGAVWLVAARAERPGLGNAALIGGALGLVFLAHTVPAVLLSGMVVSAGVAAQGFRARTLLWLMLVAGMELACAMPFLWPLIAEYRLHIANPGPGAWAHPALGDWVTTLPNLGGGAALGWLLWRRAWRDLPTPTVALLGTWIGLCLLFLGRHYACAAVGETGGICGIFVVAAHHYHAYLQAAWASVAGLALVRVLGPPSRLPFGGTMPCRLWLDRSRAGLVVRTGISLSVLAAGFAFLTKPDDIALQRLGSTRPELILDLDAYGWIIRQTGPEDLFVTELPPNEADMGPAAATVMAAGRRLVAPPALHANPYVAWEARNARRLRFLAAVSGRGGALCAFQAEAGDGAALLMLPSDRAVDPAAAVPVHRSAFNTIYRLAAEQGCPGRDRVSGKGGEDFLQRLELVPGRG